MNYRGGNSLLITLGVAAIDMLCCAFVSTVLLFVMFLLPQQTAGSDLAGPEDLLLVKWSLDSKTEVTLGIEIGPLQGDLQMIWGNDPSSMTDACANLSRSIDLRNACYFSIPRDPRSLEGILVIERPKEGKWGLKVYSSDTSSHYYAEDFEPIALQVVVVGREVSTYRIDALNPGTSIDLRNVKGDGVNENALNVD